MDLAYLPSPSTGVLHLGPVPLRAYAFCIILGVFVAVWLGNRRWVARGGDRGVIADVTIWAVPFGLVGGRLYHVLTSPDAYFGNHGEPIRALYVWEGGLGIWGAIALGGLGAWIGCRRRCIPLPAFADAIAPGIAVAQAIGRWGNWFNQELYGRPTTLPWGLEIDRAHRPFGMLDIATYHPTFLYESLWDIGVAALVLWAARRFALGHGRAFALYAAAYTAGRFWTEYLRIDEAHTFLGLRLNDWTSVVVFLGAIAYLVVSARRLPGIEDVSRPQSEGVDDAVFASRADVVDGARQGW
ncbi:prolipoprotein diacylglyceryl transferase [Streptomyces sp. NPDC059819]|uniref:prolipoprotein diacylglyceryl transferase n=1 Tax=Streptomyces sp. NPDC059819 TaxID=3346963 RepID=UPI00366A4026